MIFDKDKETEDKFEDGPDKFETMDSVRTEEFYTPPSNLKLSEDIKGRFREGGFYLKWINRHNVRKRTHPSEGYVLVSPKEFTADELLSIGDIENLGFPPRS